MSNNIRFILDTQFEYFVAFWLKTEVARIQFRELIKVGYRLLKTHFNAGRGASHVVNHHVQKHLATLKLGFQKVVGFYVNLTVWGIKFFQLFRQTSLVLKRDIIWEHAIWNFWLLLFFNNDICLWIVQLVLHSLIFLAFKLNKDLWFF